MTAEPCSCTCAEHSVAEMLTLPFQYFFNWMCEGVLQVREKEKEKKKH